MDWNYAIFRTHMPRGEPIDIPFVIPGDSSGKLGLHGLLITGAYMHNIAGRHATEKQVICEACNHYNGSHYEVQRLLPYQAPHTILKRVLHNFAKREWYFSEKLRDGNATTFSYNKLLAPASVAFDNHFNAQSAQRTTLPNNNMATCEVQGQRTVNSGLLQASQTPSNIVFPWLGNGSNNEHILLPPGFRNAQAESPLSINPTPTTGTRPSEQNRTQKENSQALKQEGQEKKGTDTSWENFSPPNSPPPPPPPLPEEGPNFKDRSKVNNDSQNIEPNDQLKSTTIQQEPNQADTGRIQSDTPRNPETPAQCYSNEKVAGSGGKSSSGKEKASSKGECSLQIQVPEIEGNSESEKRGREESESDVDERKLLNAAIKSLQKRLKKAEAELFQAKKDSEEIESKATHNEGLQEKLDLLSEENKLKSKQIKAVRTQIKSFDERKQKLIAVLETPT